MQFALNENFTEVEFLMFLKRLYEWRDWLKSNPNDIYILSDTTEILAEQNLYPVGEILKKLAKNYKVASAQAADLEQFMTNLLRQAQKIDSLCEACELDLEKVEIPKKTDVQLPERAKKIDEGLSKLLWFTNCHKEIKESHDGSYVVFANDMTGQYEVEMTGSKLVEQDEEVSVVEEKKRMQINFKTSIKEFLKDENTPVLICQNIENKGDLDFAIRVSIYQYKKLKKLGDAYMGFSFYVQDSFFKDFCRNRYPDKESVLRSLMEAMPHTVMNVNLAQRHPLRTGKGGNNPQRKSHDKTYLAWRRFVTSSIKMHYWQKDDDFWFANIDEHDFDWILEEFDRPKTLTLLAR